MAKKPTNLAAALAAGKDEPPAPETNNTPARQATKPKAPRSSGRAGQSSIAGWFDMPVKNTLDELRLSRQKELGRRVTTQEIMGEAFNDLFKKYGFPEVAPTKGQEG